MRTKKFRKSRQTFRSVGNQSEMPSVMCRRDTCQTCVRAIPSVIPSVLASVHNPRRTFLDSAEKGGCILLKCFQASPSEGCIITPSTAWCDWCHVMCSAVLDDMNNLCNLGVIGKYLRFLYATRVFPLLVLGL